MKTILKLYFLGSLLFSSLHAHHLEWLVSAAKKTRGTASFLTAMKQNQTRIHTVPSEPYSTKTSFARKAIIGGSLLGATVCVTTLMPENMQIMQPVQDVSKKISEVIKGKLVVSAHAAEIKSPAQEHDPDDSDCKERLAYKLVKQGQPVTEEHPEFENFMSCASLKGKLRQHVDTFLRKHPDLLKRTLHSVHDPAKYDDAPPMLKGYIIKAPRIRCTSKNQISRVVAVSALQYLDRKKYKFETIVFPQKWLHRAPDGSLVVVAEKMDLVSWEENCERWSKVSLNQLYEVLLAMTEVGNWDFQRENMWFTKGGKIAFIDNDRSVISNDVQIPRHIFQEGALRTVCDSLCFYFKKSDDLIDFCSECKTKNVQQFLEKLSHASKKKKL